MATENLETKVNSIVIDETKPVANSTHDHIETFSKRWGFDLEELYKLALTFYKEKDGKAIHLTYKDKLKLVAFTKQVSHGKYRTDASPEVGFLDVVGNDRRQAWQELGDMSRESAMTEFVKVLNSVCPLFKPYIQAHKTEQEELERIRKEEEERIRREQEEEKQRSVLEEETKAREQQEKVKQSQQESQIRAALNQQTAIHFKQYAEQQFPNNTEQQDSLITQLQEQHYQQYMQQVYQQQLLHQQEQYKQLQAMQEGGDPALNTTDNAVKKKAPKTTDENGVNDGEEADDEEDEEELSENGMPPIAAASMWTRKDLSEFKNNLQKDKDSVIKVGSGETVTVRVPTHEDGTCLFWEFATDSYDIGFGVYFEWTVSPSNQVSVHVSESSDEEDVEDEETKKKGDLESGSNSKQDNKPPTDEIIPIYRRDCHEEVYCGSHMYPGRGVYLLKFDNSYSLWRGKTLYYRVYYTR